MVAVSDRAEVIPTIGSGYIRTFTIINEGTGFTETPAVLIDPPQLGVDPNVVSILTKPNQNNNTGSLKQLVVFHSGQGYTEAPNIVIQGDGRGAEVGCEINVGSNGILEFEVSHAGSGYPEDVDIIVYDEDNMQVARGLALSDGEKIVAAVITDPGEGLTENITAVVDAPMNAGTGEFIYNEIVIGQSSGTQARVRDWNSVTKSLEVSNTSKSDGKIFFNPGELVVGQTSGATYAVSEYDDKQTEKDDYSQNDIFEEEAIEVVDFSEFNPFGDY